MGGNDYNACRIVLFCIAAGSKFFFDLGVDFWQKLFYNERATFQLFKKAVTNLFLY